MAIKRSLKAQAKKAREQQIKEVNTIIRNAVKNFDLLSTLLVEGNPEETYHKIDFLSTLLVEGNPEETYHKIMDFREAVEKMVVEINEETKKGEA